MKMPKRKSSATISTSKQRRFTALFSFLLKRNPHALDKFCLMLMSGMAILVLAAFSERAVAAFHGELSQTYSCELQKVSDGDTIRARCEQQDIYIRLAGIDAPEIGQKPFGGLARNALQHFLPKHFEMQYWGSDRYQRSLGVLYVYGRDINLAMIQEGYAFAYDGKDTPQDYNQAERDARRNKKGFWAASTPPINPKRWRRYHL
ncbi:MAG: thermonuclease family protein [Cardiobacteriaceae bacterium]|nr:thermonuclease family protein [Cardiobacteriaceae bacterium]